MSLAMEACVNGSDDGEKNTAASQKVEKSILDLFYKIVHTRQNVRIGASVSFIRVLLSKQTKHDEKNSIMCSDLQYSVERLVRGMSSSREAARQGFSVLLSEILRLFPQVEIDCILKLIDKHLPVSNRQEKCPAVIGQLLVYSAMVRSGRLLDSPFLSLVLMNMYRLSHDRSYIQDATYKLILHLFDSLDESHFKKAVLPHLQEELAIGWEQSSADNMWLLLLVLRKFPDALSKKFMKQHWGDTSLLSEDTVHHWKRIIKQSTIAHPNMHPVCREFLYLCIQEKTLKHLWNPVISEGLFETNQNEKSYLGFSLVKEALSNTQNKKLVKTIMSQKFCSSLSYAYMNANSPLNSAATKLTSFLSQYVGSSTDADLQMAVLKPLLQVSNSLILSKRKEVTAMISSLEKEAIIEFSELLKLVVFGRVSSISTQDEEGVEGDSGEDDMQISAISQISVLVSHPKIISDVEWRRSTLKFLFIHSFYLVPKPIGDMPEICMGKTTDSFTERMRAAFKKGFTSALDSMNFKSTLNQRLEALLSLTKFWDHVLKLEDKVIPLFNTSKIQEPWKRIKKLSKKLQRQRDDGKNSIENGALNLLLLHLGFQLFLDGENIPPILEELEICCEKLIALPSGNSSGTTAPEGSEEEAEVESVENHPWLQVFVDILLSLLSQPSHHLRNVVQSVFRLICPFVNQDTLQLIFDVISPKDEDSALVEENETSEGDSEDKSSDDEDKSSDDEDDDDGEVDEDFKMRIKNSLGAMADLGEEEEDIVLSDSEMFKLDAALSAAFQTRHKAGHKQITSEQKASFEFKTRCLNLLTCYLKAKPTLSNVLKCVKPVFAAYEWGNQNHHFKQLTSSSVNVFKQIIAVKGLKNAQEVDASELTEILEYSLGKSQGRKMPKDVKAIVCSLCAFIIMCERKLDPNLDASHIQDLDSPCMKKYFETLENFVKDSNSKFSPEVFVRLSSLHPGYAWVTLEFLSKNTFGASRSVFKPKQVLSLIFPAMQGSKGYKHASKKQWSKLVVNMVEKFIQECGKINDKVYKDSGYATDLMRMLLTLNSVFREKFHKNMMRSFPAELLAVLQSLNDDQLPKRGQTLRQNLIHLVEDNATQKEKATDKCTKGLTVEEDMMVENEDDVEEENTHVIEEQNEECNDVVISEKEDGV